MADKFTPEQIKRLQDLHSKVKVSRLLGAVFAIMGIGLFLMLFQSRVKPDIGVALGDISTLGIFILPFVPAVICSLIARWLEKRYLALRSRQ